MTLTFEEWFAQYMSSFTIQAEDYDFIHDVAQKAWQRSEDQHAMYVEELARLAEYDRSVHGN